jgi:hypothetical protein
MELVMAIHSHLSVLLILANIIAIPTGAMHYYHLQQEENAQYVRTLANVEPSAGSIHGILFKIADDNSIATQTGDKASQK